MGLRGETSGGGLEVSVSSVVLSTQKTTVGRLRLKVVTANASEGSVETTILLCIVLNKYMFK